MLSRITSVPTKFIDIDFETRSELDITVVGARKYAEHPSTEILMISFSINQRDIYNVNPYISDSVASFEFMKALRLVKKGKAVFRAHHSEFEYWIWNLVATRQFDWPPFDITKFYDTMVLTCAMGFPASLENAGTAIGLKEQKAAKEGKRLINFFCKPSRKKGEKWNEPRIHMREFKEFIEYCNQDVRTQIEIARECKPMTLRQYRVFLLTELMNVRGLPIDENMAKGAIELVEQYKEQACIQIKKLTKGKIDSPTQNKLKDWLNTIGCDIPNLQAPVIEKYLASKTLSPKARKALELRSSASKSSTAKYTAALTYLTKDKTVHGFIKAFIARTGRWGGRGLQIQNFSKPSKHFPYWCDYEVLAEAITDVDGRFIELLYSGIMDSLKAATRAMIAAPKGFKFVSADYSQIEARIVMWIANDPVGLNDFSGAGRIYENMAGTIFQISPEGIKKPSFERDLGKETVLGCGFGMGWPKFLSTCVDARNLPVDAATAQKAVKEYRKRYKKVPQAWKDCEKAAIKAIQFPNRIFPVCEGKLKYYSDGKHLYAVLPSGREICYPFAKIRIELNTFGNEQEVVFYKNWNTQAKVGQRWQYERIWGGTFFQHGVQGTAADIMAHGMITAEQNNYFVLFTVHDESVSIVKSNFGSYKEYEKILCTLEPWAKGLPIVAEGWEGTRYRK